MDVRRISLFYTVYFDKFLFIKTIILGFRYTSVSFSPISLSSMFSFVSKLVVFSVLIYSGSYLLIKFLYRHMFIIYYIYYHIFIVIYRNVRLFIPLQVVHSLSFFISQIRWSWLIECKLITYRLNTVIFYL